MHVGQHPSAAFALLLLVFGPPTASAQDANTLLEDVRDRHQSALEAIRTLTFSFEQKALKSEALRHDDSGMVAVGGITTYETGPGQHWQMPGARRTRALWSDGSTVDEVVRFGRSVRAVSTKKNGPDKEWKVTTQTYLGLEPGQLPNWALFQHESRDYVWLPFHAVLHQPHQVRSVERLPAGPEGRPGEIRVVLEHDRGVYEFWFSPGHNYLIRKRIVHPVAEPRHRYETEIAGFAETEPGRFFPAVIDYRSFEDGELKQHEQTTVSEIKINRPIPNAAFRIPGIEGSWCDDLAMKVRFRVDADGYRVGAPQPILTAARPEEPRRPQTPPDPAGPTTPFWLWAAIAVLALFLCTAVYENRWLRTELRKRRLQNESDAFRQT